MPVKGFLIPRLLLACGIFATTPRGANGQFLEPVDTNLFGDEFVKTMEVRNGGMVVNNLSRSTTQSSHADGYEYLLLFQDGRQLRGRMETVGKDEILWKRPDFSEPLRLRREDVRRVYLTPENVSRQMNFGLNAGQIVVADMRGRTIIKKAPAGTGVPATLQIGGDDWLFGGVTSQDGQTFLLRFGEKEAPIEVPRAQIEWMFFDWNAARGGGYRGSMLGLEDWLSAAPSARRTDDGAIVITGENEWFGRSLPQPRRFEISMELSPDTETGSHLWLQPFNPSPNSFGTGTVDVEFGSKELALRRFTNNMDQERIPITGTGLQDAGGPVRYRILYDSDEQRLVIFRNGKKVTDWIPKEPKPDAAANVPPPQISSYVLRSSIRNTVLGVSIAAAIGSSQPSPEGVVLGSCASLLAAASHHQLAAQYAIQQLRSRHPRITGLCLSGGFAGRGDGRPLLKFRRFQVSPWDGILPQEGAASAAGGQLSGQVDDLITGKLESISEKELVFSQRKVPRSPGTLVRFSQEPTGGVEPVARLDLGAFGEVSAAALEIRDGKIHARTAFATELELPVASLNAISFPTPAPARGAQGDALVFKNGDELAGELLSAANGGPLRWKLPGGQEVQIDGKRVAGVRFAGPAAATPKKASTEGNEGNKGAEVGKAGSSVPPPSVQGTKTASLPSLQNPGPPAQQATLELRNGDRLRGAVKSFDEKQVGFLDPILGPVTIGRERVWSLFPQAASQIRNGADDPVGWMSTEMQAGPFAYRAREKKKVDPRLAWLYLDGCYLPRQGRRPNGQVEQVFLGCAPPRQESGLFEVRGEITGTGGNPPNCMVIVSGKPANVSGDSPEVKPGAEENGGQSAICANFSYMEMYVEVINPQGQKSRQIAFGQKMKTLSTRLSLRIFVNSQLGTADIMLDGVLLARIGQQADERAPGIGETVQFCGNSYDGHPMIFSNLWIGPWDGELPRGEAAGQPSTALANGDASAAVPSALQDGNYLLETEVGPLRLPASAVSAIAFGGEPSKERSAARLRLVNGSTVHVAAFDYRDRIITGRSGILGELRLPLESIAELIFDPSPIRLPRAPLGKGGRQTAAAGGPDAGKPETQK